MFLAYFDESGYSGAGRDPDQPVLVVAGVLVNAFRATKTARDWRLLLDDLEKFAGGPLPELKGRELFRGDGPWKGCDHTDRAEARTRVLDWLDERKHRLVASAIRYDSWANADPELCPDAQRLDPYVAACVHVGLAIQRLNHAKKLSALNKNRTLLVYDRQSKVSESTVSRILAEPPDWAMAFVEGRCSDSESLPVLVDSAYFADSTQAPLIQVADFLCFMIQRRAAIACGDEERFNGEQAIISSVASRLDGLMVDQSQLFPSGGRRAFARLMDETRPPGSITPGLLP